MDICVLFVLLQPYGILPIYFVIVLAQIKTLMDKLALPADKVNSLMLQQDLVNATHLELFLIMVNADVLTIYPTIQHQTDVSVAEISKFWVPIINVFAQALISDCKITNVD